jgi:hypothetical protein
MDIIDQADELLEQMQSARIAEIRSRTGLAATGRCHYCQDAVPDPALYCDADCREDHQHELDAKQRKGRSL